MNPRRAADPVPSPSAQGTDSPSLSEISKRYEEVRDFSKELSDPLETEDYVIQTMKDVSPTKWHLAHTSWFFETFILSPYYEGYRSCHDQYRFLFNSYYNAVGAQHQRDQRGFISRPTVADIFDYRAHVDEHMLSLFDRADDALLQEVAPLVEIGLHHEHQHQELLVTDIKHVFSVNPLRPAYHTRLSTTELETDVVPPRQWASFPEGVFMIGHEGGGFPYDNESPRHRVFLEAFALSTTLVSNREYLAFIEDGGYERPALWLSDGWNTVRERRWNAPLYWEKRDGMWWNFSLAGMQPLAFDEPVCHVSYYEADAFARWAGARLPTEAEWEIASADVPIEGNFAGNGRLHPAPVQRRANGGSLQQLFGDVWEWTQSHYSPYPGYGPPEGALGEYNGKFMCDQFVLRGGSCATSLSHIRRTYRNFFPADARWQFMGIRLANGGKA